MAKLDGEEAHGEVTRIRLNSIVFGSNRIDRSLDAGPWETCVGSVVWPTLDQPDMDVRRASSMALFLQARGMGGTR